MPWSVNYFPWVSQILSDIPDTYCCYCCGGGGGIEQRYFSGILTQHSNYTGADLLHIGDRWQVRVLDVEIVLEGAYVECFVDLAIPAFELLLGRLWFHLYLLDLLTNRKKGNKFFFSRLGKERDLTRFYSTPPFFLYPVCIPFQRLDDPPFISYSRYKGASYSDVRSYLCNLGPKSGFYFQAHSPILLPGPNNRPGHALLRSRHLLKA